MTPETTDSDEDDYVKLKKQIDYLYECNQKFKKETRIVQSKKRTIIENILIYGFREFIAISEKNNIDDNCTVRVYFYIQGLRDSIITDKILKREWKGSKRLNQQIIDMIKTFSFYLNNKKVSRDVYKLMRQLVKIYKEKTKIDLSKYIIAPIPRVQRILVEDDFLRKIAKYFINLRARYIKRKTYPKPKLINSRE